MLDEELLDEIKKGYAPAFRQFYELFKDRIYNTCLSYLQNIPEAEEVLQDVFVEIHHSAAKFKGQSSVATWIYRIAINKCIDRKRYRNRQKRFAFISGLFGSDGTLIYDPADFVHPGALAENREQAKILFGAMQNLPAQQQTAFILRHIEGLPQKEIAAIMEVSEKAVESLIQRAKGNLRRQLGDLER